MRKNIVVRYVLIAAGCLSFGLGVVGIFLPLLPTTPFLLLAAACFIRSSDALYQWLINHRWFGSYIRNYRDHKAVSLNTKVITLVLLWAAIGYSAFAVMNSTWIRLLLLFIAAGVTLHVLSLKTLTPEMLDYPLKENTPE